MLIDGTYLLEHGVPYEAIFGPITRPLSPERRHAMTVIIGTRHGGEYDWSTRRWKVKRS